MTPLRLGAAFALILALGIALMVELVATPEDNARHQGDQAYRDARFDAAVEFYQSALARADRAAEPEFLYDLALAALQAGAARDAEIAAELLGVRSETEFRSHRDFLLGNAAFMRCEQAEARAQGPEADPTAYQLAIALAEQAQEFWLSALGSHDDWPAARRNVERCLRKIDALAQEQAEAERNRKPKTTPGLDENSDPNSESTPPSDQPELLSRLFDQLDRKQKQKLAKRRDKQDRTNNTVERDW